MKTVTDDHPITIHVSFKFYQYSSIWENVLKLCPAEVEFFDSSQLITDHWWISEKTDLLGVILMCPRELVLYKST